MMTVNNKYAKYTIQLMIIGSLQLQQLHVLIDKRCLACVSRDCTLARQGGETPEGCWGGTVWGGEPPVGVGMRGFQTTLDWDVLS